MRQMLGGRWFPAGAAAAGLMVAWHTISAAHRRQRQLRRGEIRELRSVWQIVRGCRIHARVSTAAGGDKLPVVLVHGFGVSSSYFMPAAERLGVEFAVYAPDLPGHGKSDMPREALDVSGLADALVAWMDAMGLERVCLAGNSMGGQIVVDAAVRYPQRVDRLVLIGPTADPAARTPAAHVGRLVVDAFYERISLNKLLAADYARMGPRLLPEFRFMLRDRIEDKLPRVAAPVMWVRGENDPISPQRWADEGVRLLPNGRIAVIPGWGHAVHYSAPRRFADAIAPFLRENHPEELLRFLAEIESPKRSS